MADKTTADRLIIQLSEGVPLAEADPDLFEALFDRITS